ncbi:hypothetical protein [Nitrosomonas sp. Is37]|uniref:hypothetical protein n=1 Tax=Nitrosomonas sp. Is37 TaxID=3080535 RepID=UPI00294B5EE1|nr:hypothetical protein [Nitrosomonas sp. Is37]MDV6343018.1 hypothetical protein [Nitrosomonas sp. Is37]
MIFFTAILAFLSASNTFAGNNEINFAYTDHSGHWFDTGAEADLATTNTVVKMLSCDPDCHEVQYGARKGGGYCAYVSSKFSNRILVVDPDPRRNVIRFLKEFGKFYGSILL